MKFAHLADLHIGSWREPKLRDLSMQAFSKAMDACISMDFIIIAGDLFNTALPDIDKLNVVVKRFRSLKEHGVNIYLVPGSHDFSPSGRTMINVLESASLVHNVCKGDIINNKLKLKFTVDKKTGAKITGIMGKRGMLDSKMYLDLLRDNLETEPGFKIFVFHTTINELKPKNLQNVDSYPASLLPKNFDYYAGGHVHYRKELSLPQYKNIVQPGALFPNNFTELESQKCGGFYVYDNGTLNWHSLNVISVVPIKLNVEGKTSADVVSKSIETINEHDVKDALVTLRYEGTITDYKLSDINFRDIIAHCYYKGCYFVMKNTSALYAKDFEMIAHHNKTAQDIENEIVSKEPTHAQTARMLISSLSQPKKEGETVRDYESKILKESLELLNIS